MSRMGRMALMALMMQAAFESSKSGSNLYSDKNNGIYGRISSNKRPVVIKRENKPEREFIIKGVKIMAYSKKDAIKRYQHKYLNKK